MRALIQRVSEARVTVNGQTVGKIGHGILLFLAVGKNDSEKDVDFLINKINNLRIFESEAKKMDLSLKDIDGELLAVSQFTLYGNVNKGRRPDFTDAANPDLARKLYKKFIEKCENKSIKTQTGEFAAMMDISLVNDGPVTFFIDSESKSANI